MTDKEIVAEVTEKLPYPLYKVISLLKQDDPELIEEAKAYFSRLIKELYIDLENKVPDEADELLDQLIAYVDEKETEYEEIRRRLLRVRNEAYVEEHGLEYIIEAIDNNTPDKSMSKDLDYEFVVFHHKILGLDLPTDPNLILDMFGSWLTVCSYI